MSAVSRPLPATLSAYTALIQAIPEPAALLSADGVTYVAVNGALAGRLKADAVSIQGTPWRDWYPAETVVARGALVERAVAEKVPVTFHDERVGGHFLHQICPVLDAEGAVSAVLVLVRDVTREQSLRAEAEAAARRLQATLDAIPAAVGLYSLDGTVIDVNRAPLERAGLRREDVIGKKVWDTAPFSSSPPLAAQVAEILRIAMSGETVRWGVRVPRGNGTSGHFEMTTSPLRDEAGRVHRLLGFAIDVTERDRALGALSERESQLRASLREKETLLREIHHRVKNNLQIILSLLHFQAKKAGPEQTAAFVELRHRVHAISQLHERLYLAKDVARVEMADYLRGIVGDLVCSYRPDGAIEVTCAAEGVALSVDQALPVAMIVGELVTNALKYAFEGRARGGVGVTLRRDGARVVLVASDDGVGFPVGFDPSAVRSFGWELIRTLAMQLDAEVEARTDGGARVRLSFEPPAATEGPAAEGTAQRS
jgi:PAS domain S-box-containing protein